MGKLGYQEIVLIALVILIMFGGRKIPEFMRGLGKGIREFNDAKNNDKKEIEKDKDWSFFIKIGIYYCILKTFDTNVAKMPNHT